jgi:hypothetical protein
LLRPGDEDEMLDAGFARLVDHMLDQRTVDHGSISLGIALVAGRKRVPSRRRGKWLCESVSCRGASCGRAADQATGWLRSFAALWRIGQGVLIGRSANILL